jgi:ABC-2 type transport system permease protein
MTTTTSARPLSGGPAKPLRFYRVLHSEWIKLWSLRSTYWTILATLAAMVLIAVMLGSVSIVDEPGAGIDGTTAIAMGYGFAQLVVAVLGVLTITGEYATGMIRSTLTAVPARLPALFAKSILVAGVGFVLGVLGVTLAYLTSYPLFGAANAADLSDPDVQRVFWGSGLYLAGVALFGLAVGALLRHTAGALTAVLGILLLLSTFWQLLMMGPDWFASAYRYLPSVAGESIVLPRSTTALAEGPQSLAPWTGFGVFLLYVAVTYVVAAVLLRRRDA